METVERKIVNTKEIIKILGISATTLINLKRKVKIPFLDIGGTHRYDVDRVIETSLSHPINNKTLQLH